ncbi:hypothetical protein [Streptomyces sp. NPDC001205]
MTSWLAVADFLLYLTGIGTLATALPHMVRREPLLRLQCDTNPVGLCLWFAIVIVAWPDALITSLLTRRKTP